jgi:hypothetical protein
VKYITGNLTSKFTGTAGKFHALPGNRSWFKNTFGTGIL